MGTKSHTKKVRIAFELVIITPEVRREWNNVKSVRANDFQPGILYPAILSFRVKVFSDIEVLKKHEVYESFAQN